MTTFEEGNTGVLSGMRVIDFTLGQHGPVATAMLGDMGAEVIHVEPPEGDVTRGFLKMSGLSVIFPGGRNFYFETNNRNKKSLVLDLKKEKAREIIYRLVEKSDIFVTNFLKPAVEKLGMGYGTLSKYNSKLIYAAANAWGPKGPDADNPGLDYGGQARSGFMFAVGHPDSPPFIATGGLADQMGSVSIRLRYNDSFSRAGTIWSWPRGKFLSFGKHVNVGRT